MEAKIIFAIVVLLVEVLTVENGGKPPEFKTTTKVDGVVGDSVTLPCRGTSASSSSSFNWQFYFSDNNWPTTMCTNGKVDEAFADICYLPRNSSLDCSLVIRSVELNQSGKYVCSEDNGHGPFHEIHLVVSSKAPTVTTPLVSQASFNSGEESSESRWTKADVALTVSIVTNCFSVIALVCSLGVTCRLLCGVPRTQRSRRSLTGDPQEHWELLRNSDGNGNTNCRCLKTITRSGEDSSERTFQDKCWHDIYNEFQVSSISGRTIHSAMRDFYELVRHPELFHNFLAFFAIDVHQRFPEVDVIIGIDTNRIMVSLFVARELRRPFVPVRKVRDLPAGDDLYKVEYSSRNNQEGWMFIQKSVCAPEQKVVFIDEKLASGGTMLAAVKLIKNLKVHLLGCVVVVEDSSHNGRQKVEAVYPDVTIVPLFITASEPPS